MRSMLRRLPGIWYLTRAQSQPRQPRLELAVTVAVFLFLGLVVVGAIEHLAPREARTSVAARP
jgi:hypothetical protein